MASDEATEETRVITDTGAAFCRDLDPHGLLSTCDGVLVFVDRIYTRQANVEAQIIVEEARAEAIKERIQVAKWNKSIAKSKKADCTGAHETRVELADAREHLAELRAQEIRNQCALLASKRAKTIADAAAQRADVIWMLTCSLLRAATSGAPSTQTISKLLAERERIIAAEQPGSRSTVDDVSFIGPVHDDESDSHSTVGDVLFLGPVHDDDLPDLVTDEGEDDVGEMSLDQVCTRIIVGAPVANDEDDDDEEDDEDVPDPVPASEATID